VTDAQLFIAILAIGSGLACIVTTFLYSLADPERSGTVDLMPPRKLSVLITCGHCHAPGQEYKQPCDYCGAKVNRNGMRYEAN